MVKQTVAKVPQVHGERVRVDGTVDGGIGRGGGAGIREIMYGSILTRLAWLGDPREWGRLKQSNE